MSSCPGDGTLLLLGTDALGDGTYAGIEQHVEGCPECKAVLERLAHRRRDPTIAFPGPARLPRIPGFEIQSELDRGAMGAVHLAIETGLDRLVRVVTIIDIAPITVIDGNDRLRTAGVPVASSLCPDLAFRSLLSLGGATGRHR
jgi:hypothetical protein